MEFRPTQMTLRCLLQRVARGYPRRVWMHPSFTISSHEWSDHQSSYFISYEVLNEI